MPIMDESDVSLPKATLSKMIRELVPEDLRIRQDFVDMLIDCCTEFVSLLSSESNEVSNRDKKNTIHPEHVLKALEELGFAEFIPAVRDTWDSWKQESKHKTTTLRPRGHKTAAEAAGYTEEQQIALQQRLFADARARSTTLHEHSSSIYHSDNTQQEVSRVVDLSSSPVRGDESGNYLQQNSNLYEALAARTDILPIQPLPVPALSSEFQPSVISTTVFPDEAPSQISTIPVSHINTPQTTNQQVLDFSHISMSQPVILLHNGVQQSVSWQKLISQVAMLPQFTTLQQQMLQNAEMTASEDFSLQIPACSQIPVLQPSFPEHTPTVFAPQPDNDLSLDETTRGTAVTEPSGGEGNHGVSSEPVL